MTRSPGPAEPQDVEMGDDAPTPAPAPPASQTQTQAPAPAPAPAPAASSSPPSSAPQAPEDPRPEPASEPGPQTNPQTAAPQPDPATQDDRAPSPAEPARPGPRAARMQQLYAQSLRRALGKLGWDNFAACYPTIAARAEPVLRQVQAQMVEKLGEKCEKEFEHIMTTRQVVPKLNELEALIADASRRRASSAAAPPIPPHRLPPQAILSAHLLPSLASHQSHLNARLQTTQSRNALLFDAIAAQRAQVHALLADVEHLVGDVRAANAVLEGVVDDIAREARDVDAEGGRSLT